MDKLRDFFTSSGALSTSSYKDSPLDLHSYIADGIQRLPKEYQPPQEWYRWIPGKSPLSTSEWSVQIHSVRAAVVPGRGWAGARAGNFEESDAMDEAQGKAKARKKMDRQ